MAESQLKEAITSDADIISSLPEYIREKFLVHLPIKEAVRTCILSKDWRYTWSTIPDLVVDVGGSSNFDQLIADDENSKIIRFVDELLTRHNGNIRKFKIYGIKYCFMVFREWMRTLSKKYISEIIVQDANEVKYLMPYYLFTCSNLKVLALSCCLILVTTGINFNGFKLLHTLELRDCIIFENGLAELISGCPLLEQLTLFQSKSYFSVIKISAPNLRELTICSCFIRISLLTPKLIKANFSVPHSMEGATTSCLIQSLGSISHVQSLGIHCDFFWNSWTGSLKKYPPAPKFNHLMIMAIILDPLKQHLMLLLFENVPNLRKLIVFLQPVKLSSYSSFYYKQVENHQDAYKQVENHQDAFFENLRDVNIIPNIGSESVLKFAKFILNSAPVLERLTIRGHNEYYVASKLKNHKNLSKTAEVIFDESCFNVDDQFQGFYS